MLSSYRVERMQKLVILHQFVYRPLLDMLVLINFLEPSCLSALDLVSLPLVGDVLRIIGPHTIQPLDDSNLPADAPLQPLEIDKDKSHEQEHA